MTYLSPASQLRLLQDLHCVYGVGGSVAHLHHLTETAAPQHRQQVEVLKCDGFRLSGRRLLLLQDVLQVACVQMWR